MEKIKLALGSGRWWFVTSVVMAAGWALAFSVARLFVDKDAGVLATLLIGATSAFAGRFSALLDE